MKQFKSIGDPQPLLMVQAADFQLNSSCAKKWIPSFTAACSWNRVSPSPQKKNVFFGGISTMVHLSRKLAEKWSSNFQFSALALFYANLFDQVFLLDLFKYSLFCIFLEALCEVDKTIVSETQKFNQRTLSPWHVWVRWDKETCFVFSASLFGFFSWIFCYFSFISL